MLTDTLTVESLVALVATVSLLAWAIHRGMLADPRVEAVLEQTWPDLWRVRRRWFPRLERRFPFVKFVLPVHDAEWVGSVDAPPAEVRDRLQARDDVFPNNCAGLKQWDGRWECGSYAHREEGLFGTWQTHIRLFDGPGDKTAFAAHYERSPLAGVDEGLVATLRGAWQHYHPTPGETWLPREGVRNARELFDDMGFSP